MKYNTDYFNNIDTERKAYFLGFIMADGCNYKGLVIRIATEDDYILKELLIDMDSTIKIQTFKPKEPNHKPTSRVRLQSELIHTQLCNLGIPPRKAYHTKFPDIDKSLYPHFIRGVLDGDGSITTDRTTNQKRFRISGSFELIDKIQNILIQECGLNKTKLESIVKKKGTTSVMHYVGNTQIKRIYDYLYKDATIFLKRKQKRLTE